jgi:NAD(P)-dependent dehydrogenase (short-subunit alcohol dehydrogenase family)
MKEGPFFGKSVIVTGASLGIGREIALQLAEQGARLALGSRSNEELQRVANLCRERGATAIVTTADVSKEADCRTLVERTISKYGQIDALINNAGIGMRAMFGELPSPHVMETVMGVNFWGSVYCTYHALSHLKASNGRIVGVVSGGGKFPTPGACGYGASKHALVGFYDTIRIELKGTGVSVTAAYPEWVATGITSRAPKADGTPAGEISPHEKGATRPEVCARRILKAAADREREVVSLKLKIGVMMAEILPRVIDGIAVRAYL